MSVARYTGFRSAIGWAQAVAGKVTGSVAPIRSDIVVYVDQWNESMAAGLGGILEEL